MKRFLLFIFFIFSTLIFSQEIDIKKKEPLFSFDILTEDDFYLFLDGTWKLSLNTSSQGDVSGVLDNIIFKQVPDFTASLWLFNKFFFEAEIKEKSKDNLFLLGYQNNNGTFKEARIGNSDININEYAGYTPPISVQKAPGLRFKIGTERTEHEVLGRYTSEVKDSQVYRGFNLVEETTQLLNNYTKGHFYIIPQTGQSNITLYYIEDGALKRLDNQEYIYFKDRSLLYVADPEIDVIYTEVNSLDKEELYQFINPESNPGVGIGISADSLWNYYVESISGKHLLKIKDRGDFSPFEHLGVYSVETEANINKNSIELYINDSKTSDYLIIDSFIVLWNENTLYNSVNLRYPFLNLDNGIYRSGGSGYNSDYLIDISVITPVEEITVPTDAKEGSLKVSINGIYNYDFNHDTESGVITFKDKITPFDNIVINYDTEIVPGTGNLLLSYGSRYNLNDNFTLELSQTGSWDFSTDDYSYTFNNNRGEFESRSRLKFDSNNFNAELNNTLEISNPDTLGKYLLFEYNQSKITIPFNQTNISENSKGSVDFIKRDTDDESKTANEIISSNINPLGGAYFGNHLYNRSSNRVLILESQNLEGESSLVSLELDEYSDSYSFSRNFSLDIFNASGEYRDLNITFINPGLENSETVTKTVPIDSAAGYKEYKIDFTREERDKLAYLTNISFSLENCDKTLLFIKDLTFTGDSIVTHRSDKEIVLNKKENELEIKQVNKGDNYVTVSSKINKINLKSYNFLSFTIDKNSLIKDNSQFELLLKSYSTPTGRLLINESQLIPGANKISVDLNENRVKINGSYTEGVKWEDLSNFDSNYISFSFESDGNGEITISEVILTEPKLGMKNKTTIDLEYRPEISIKVKNFPIIDDLILRNSNSVRIESGTVYSGKSGFKGVFIGSSIDSEISYSDKIDNFKYTVLLPYEESPLRLKDSFEYGINSSRNNSLTVDTNILKSSLTFSDFKTSDKGLRISELSIDAFDSSPFKVILESSISQNRDDKLGNIDREVYASYYDILLRNSLDNSNKFNSVLNTTYNKKALSLEMDLESNFDQENNNTADITCNYIFNLTPGVKIGKIGIYPGIKTEYANTTQKRYVDNLTHGFNGLYEIFNDTNPYKSLTFTDLFLNKNYNKYYIDYNSSYRYLDSSLSLKLTLVKESYHTFNFIIPNTVTLSQGKEFELQGSRKISKRKQTVDIEFLLHPIVKNSFSYTRILNLEADSAENTFDWSLKAFKEFNKRMSLELKNELSLSEDSVSNLITTDYIWPGKSGPVLVIPFINKIFNNPYHYENKERLYLQIDGSNFDLGIRHDTTLRVKDINETNFYIDIGYNTSSDTPLYFETGVTFTFIF